MPENHDKSGGQQIVNDPLVRIIDNTTYQELRKDAPRNKPKKTISEWRSYFALIILVGFLVLIAIVVVADIFCNGLSDANTLLSTIGMLLEAPLGFVVGYYYKDKK